MLEGLEQHMSKLEQMVWHFKDWNVQAKDNTMSESLIDSVLYDEEILGDELPDAALEVAAGKCWEQAGNSFTLAFCTGLDTCPHAPRAGSGAAACS
jgi:hypothetical protein